MKKMILFFILLSSTTQAAFSDSNTRYLSGHEVIAKLLRAFPSAFSKPQPNNEQPPCAISAASSAGENDPLTGRSLYIEPGPSFLKWYTSCIEDITRVEFYADNISPAALKIHLGSLADMGVTFQTSVTSLKPAQLNELIKYTVMRILGPDEVVLEYGYIDDCDKFREDLGNRALRYGNVGQFLKSLETELVGRDEFLSY